jgi:predicted nuclease of predicted toxin-antitoxin system
MRILFDHNTPGPLRDSLRNYTVATTAERGWDRLTNGKLLDAAEEAGFEILLTADKGFQHQQNLTHRRIAIVILSRGNWPDVKMSIPEILDAVEAAKGGTCTLVECLMS